MKLVREEKGKNSFSITGLTVGKLESLYTLLGAVGESRTPLEDDLYHFLDNERLSRIKPFGDSHIQEEANV